jgi:hypothetical protein
LVWAYTFAARSSGHIKERYGPGARKEIYIRESGKNLAQVKQLILIEGICRNLR